MRQSRCIGFSNETFQFLHGKRADYCVYSDGKVTRTWKKSMVEEKVAVFMHHGKAVVRCNNRLFVLKHVVAFAFLPNYKKGLNVICIDRDEKNCAVENLCVIGNRQLGKLTGHKAKSFPIQIENKNNGEEKTFRSVRQAAKALHCSYQTVFDYMNGRVKNSILDGLEIRRSNV